MFGGLTRNILQRRTGAFWVGRLWLMMAALLLVTGTAKARTADISLTVIGDERMTEELRRARLQQECRAGTVSRHRSWLSRRLGVPRPAVPHGVEIVDIPTLTLARGKRAIDAHALAALLDRPTSFSLDRLADAPIASPVTGA